MESGSSSRRERQRAATVGEITDVARQLLVQEGPGGVTLRAIARTMGLTAPAIYRYFPSHEDLMDTLCGQLYDEMCAAMAEARDALPAEDITARTAAVSWTFRSWSVAHPAEFGLIFGSPPPGLCATAPGGATGRANEAGQRFAAIFGSLFTEIWRRKPFPVPAPDQMDPALHTQLEQYGATIGADLPAGAVQVFLSSWIRLYGTVTMEVFGHLSFALTDVTPMFEAELLATAQRLGLLD